MPQGDPAAWLAHDKLFSLASCLLVAVPRAAMIVANRLSIRIMENMRCRGELLIACQLAADRVDNPETCALVK